MIKPNKNIKKCKTNMKTTAIALIKILARLAIATLVWFSQEETGKT